MGRPSLVLLTSTKTQLPTQHQATSFFPSQCLSYHSTNVSFCSSFHLPRLTLTHTPTLIRTKEASNFTLKVSSTSQETDSATEEEELSRTRLLAQNLPWTSTHEDIRSLFEKHGKVIDVELSMYNKTRNRGLAFVEMGSPEEALAAFNSLESYEYEGRKIKLTYARPKKKKIPPPPPQPKPVTFNLFVANLSYEARAKDLREFFDSGSGKVVSAEVIFHDTPRKSSGYGFVSFKTKKEANEALSEFQEKIFMGRPLRVAPSRRFVRLQAEESAKSEDTSSELNVNGAESDKAD